MDEERGVSVGRWRGWVLRHPLFVAALWVVLAYTAWQSMALLLWVALGAVILFAALLRHWIGLLCVIAVILAIGIGGWRDAVDTTHAAFLDQSAGRQIEAVALADARGDESFWQVAAVLNGAGPKVWWQGRGEMPVEGSCIRADGGFHFAQKPRNPAEFDQYQWMEQQGLVAIFRQAPHSVAEVQTDAKFRLLADAKGWARSSMTRGLDEESGAAKVIRAVVLGEKPREDADLLEDFRHSGSMHVFSVSGLHVGMVAVLVWMVAAWSGLSRRWLVLPVIVFVFAYAWLTGANAPAVRAAWMAAVFLGAFCFRRRPDLPNALGAVLLVLLIWDVRQLQQPSVQLSYGVVTAIAFGLPWTTRWFARIGAAPMYIPVPEIRGLRLAWWRLRQWMATTLSVSTAASLGAAPLTLWHFGLVTPVSVIAALLMLPLVFLVMALAMLSLVLSPVQVATVPVNRVNGCLAETCAMVAGWMAEVPGGHWNVRAESGPVLWVYDLKQGDAAALWLPDKDGAAMLIDCGGRSSFRHPLLSSLERMGLEPDSVMLTHPDGGHVGGGNAVWRELPIDQVLMPVDKARSSAYRAWLEEAAREGVKLHACSQLPKGLAVGDQAHIEWLVIPQRHDQNRPADDRVLVMRLHWKDWKVLWLSDAGTEAERTMLESGRDLSADVIVAGSHRGDLSLGDAFVEAVGPKAIIIDNEGYPAGEGRDIRQLDHWRESGILVFDQSETGAVSLRLEDGALIIEGFINGQQLRLE